MDATTFFLTYPRCTLTQDDVWAALQSIKPVVWARVAIEAHEDGTPHVHVCVRFGERCRARNNAGFFDLGIYHGNYQVARQVRRVLEYCSKGGNFVDHGPVPTTTAASTLASLKEKASAGDRDGFDELALEARMSFQWASHIWARHGTAGNTILEAGGGTECMQLQGLQFDGGSTLVVGPSGCGKSTWAKRVAPKPALWVRHLDDLKLLSKEHKCIIFDDMEFSHLPRSTQIYIADQDDVATIHCRNTNARIPANTPKIFTANSFPFTRDEAIERRLRVVNIISLTL